MTLSGSITKVKLIRQSSRVTGGKCCYSGQCQRGLSSCITELNEVTWTTKQTAGPTRD